MALRQWFDETEGTFGALVRGKRVLIVDEVDDSRATLQYACEELLRRNSPAEICAFVVHNKMREKKGVLPPGVRYVAAAEVADHWICYPWDAAELGLTPKQYEGRVRESAGKLPLWMQHPALLMLAGGVVATVMLMLTPGISIFLSWVQSWHH